MVTGCPGFSLLKVILAKFPFIDNVLRNVPLTNATAYVLGPHLPGGGGGVSASLMLPKEEATDGTDGQKGSERGATKRALARSLLAF